MAWEYSEKTTQLFMDAVHGKPGTHMGEIKNADGVGEHGSIACGDALKFTFRVERNEEDPTKDIIVEARYLTFGCTSAIAASEALCIIVEQKHLTPIEALKITNQDIVEYLDGLPKQKIHCSVMGAEALDAAVFDWAKKRGIDLKELGVDVHEDEMDEGRVVCDCFSMTEPYIRRKIKELGLKTIPQISDAIKAGGACMACHHKQGGLQDILDDIWGAGGSSVASQDSGADAKAAVLSPYQLGKSIEKTMDEYVRPMLQQDGGDVDIIDIKDNLVYVKLVGACASCVGAAMTLKNLVEKTLKDRVDERIRVIAVEG
jgi:NifU-like protein